MPKTRNAFAFRNFDKTRILQRPYFRKFNFPKKVGKADFTDEEILNTLKVTDSDSIDVMEKTFDILETLLLYVIGYQNHIKRHGDRLTKYARAVEYKITTDLTADISKLRERHKAVSQLSMKYVGTFTASGVTSYTLGGIAINNVGGLCDKVAKLYKELDEKIKLHYRKIFARCLKQARRSIGITQEKIASRLGLTKNGYALYESAKRDPSIPTLIRLTKELNCTADYLLGLT